MFFKATLVALALLSGTAYAKVIVAARTGKATLSGTGTGSCGVVITDEGKTAGLAKSVVDCNKTITVTFGGKTVDAAVADTCDGCTEDDILLSKGAFSVLDDPSKGSIAGVTWDFKA